jgi:pimeloyl-ACP methyl ester carboxylesterase
MTKQEPRQYFYKAVSPLGFHKLAYVEWGDPDNKNVLVCVHGISRNSRDFDFLARELQADYRIVCPDVVGRGLSEATHNPASYNVSQYVSDMTVLLARLDVEAVSWLGTSMGGLIGMTMASMKNSPIKKLILNDVGIVIPSQAMQRIMKYALEYPVFKTLQEAKDNLIRRLATFGNLDDEHIQHMVNYSFKKDNQNHYTYHYDPQIFEAQKAFVNNDVHMEHLWHNITCPTLVIHGSLSDLLTADTVNMMKQLRPEITVENISYAGHTPSLMTDDQIQIIKNWLAKN